LLRGIFHPPFTRVNFVVDRRDWVIKRVGHHICSSIAEQRGIACQTVMYHEGLRSQIVHFGSRNAFLGMGLGTVHESNRVIFTWFHGAESDPNPENQAMIRAVPQAALAAEKVVTAATTARDRLIGWGVPESKIVVIPLGIDLKVFKPQSAEERERLRTTLGIPKDSVCIGSFQKDGVGWGDGMEPKLIKGPDTFLKIIERLAGDYRLFVLLTGPARGYVKRGLDGIGVPYRHVHLKHHHDVAALYPCLDLYMVTAREEGGPLSILECMATGVPVISTRVGMSIDVIRTGENGVLTEIEDLEALADAASEVIDRADLRETFRRNGLTTATAYDWRAIGMQYYERLYEPMLDSV